MVVHSNIPEKLVSTNLTYKLQLEDDLLDGGFHPVAQLGEVAKVLPLARLSTHNRLVFVNVVVGLKLFVTTLADKHLATVLPILVLD